MSAPQDLPLINVERFFQDPSIPDGSGIGHVDAAGIVHYQGQAIGRDDQHPDHARPSSALQRLGEVVKGLDLGGSATQKQRTPRREILSVFERGATKVATDTLGGLWILAGGAWQRMLPVEHLPPLPQE